MDLSEFALHREEIAETLSRGERKIAALPGRQSRVVKRGTTLIRARTEHDYVYRLQSGWAGRIRDLPNGRSQYILIFLPGDLFGVKSMFVSSHPDAIQVMADALIEQIHCEELRRAFEDDHDVATRCIWQVIEEERRLHNWIVSLGQGTSEQRLAFFLNETHGRLVLSRTIDPHARAFELPMTQQQMGEYLGISTVHVNRTLQWLHQTGVATKRGRKVYIRDEKALAALAYPLADDHERAAARLWVRS
ncbi:MAG: Crp/Fnr family transcriptional regulator [Inquilinus sp.]|jgi:CRP-like cAMP-binding protein|uniref:Crp/Fnr family transcriptional regulator n=1 Tax=Inquilinus sp. TaxID=1932117 RepID=UPI003F2EC77A